MDYYKPFFSHKFNTSNESNTVNSSHTSSTSNTSKTANTMTLTGKGQVSVTPDIAVIRLGVETRGENLAKAQEENAQNSQSVITILRQLGIQDIKTYQYTIDKIMEFENNNRVDKGYIVRNIVEIKVRAGSQIGPAIDAAVNNGANVVEGISFEIVNPDYYYQQALHMALDNAIGKAEALAMQLGAALHPVPHKIVENSMVPIPFSGAYSLRESRASAPIEPGKKNIEAALTVEFLYH